MKQMLGIIGGMGSFAGLSLANYALRRAVTNGAALDEDFPKMVYYNIPTSGLGISGVTNEKLLFRDLRNAVSHLETIGCKLIVIACASAHVLYGKLQGLAVAKILDLVEIGCEKAAQFGEVGVLCSDSSKHHGLFDIQISRFKAKCLHTTSEEQLKINEAIQAVMLNRQTRNHALDLQSVVCNLHARGAKGILLGCTELPLAVDRGFTSLAMVDAGQAAIDTALGCG